MTIRFIVARPAALAAVLALSTGCTGVAWQKTGVTEVALDEDLQQCRQVARLGARHQEWPRLDSPLTIRADPQGRPFVAPNTTQDTDRYLREQDLTRDCMQGKGYVLVPQKQVMSKAQ